MRRSAMLMLALTAGCGGKGPQGPAAGSSSAAAPPTSAPMAGLDGSESRSAPDGLDPPSEAPRVVLPSPTAAREFTLPDGMTPVDLTVSATRAEAFVLVRGAGDRTQLLSWVAGADRTTPIATLPDSFIARSVVVHPVRGSLFVAGDVGDGSQILRFVPSGSGWKMDTVYITRRRIERLVMSTRPFSGDDGSRYRIFFAAKSADGSTSIRTVTEGGRLEYQVAGPEATVDHYLDADSMPVPGRLTVPYAFPLAIHSLGGALLWRDERGCTHEVGYDSFDGWKGEDPLPAVECGVELQFTPNGRDLLSWRSGTPGVMLVREGGRTGGGLQAVSFLFTVLPVSTPDGRGVIGTVARDARTALVYAPIAVPLADVANAYIQGGTICDEALYTRNAGYLRARPSTDQLYTVYEDMHYDDGGRPALATTDLFWENFGTAYNGVFIIVERHRAMPAFWTFVDSADAALRGGTGVWPKAFAAVAAFHRGETEGEAGLIATGSEPGPSSVLDSTFNFAELKPRGHYTSDPEMERYFRAVHYLTQINQVRDAAPLAALPASVQALAQRWIDGYRPFIATSRAPIVWTSGTRSTIAPYARHPWRIGALFPLSWGADNEALEAAVYHAKWPVDEKIWVPTDTMERRLHPSGLDVGTVYGSALARTLLADTIRYYPRLGPILDGIAARLPAPSAGSSLYDRWMDAVATEWADSTVFPGTAPGPSLWDVKRLQTGLASWATLREATILVTERAAAAEMGESGFEEVVSERPRGYVEPAPRTFEAIAGLYDALRTAVLASGDLDFRGDTASDWQGSTLRDAVAARLVESAAEARAFAAMARRELRGEALSDSDYDRIQGVGGSAEHQFLIYKSLQNRDLAISIPDPLPKIADVAGDPKLGILEVAVGGPLEWHQVVPFFGRREIVVGSVYSYYEFTSKDLYDNQMWRAAVDRRARPEWVQAYVAPADGTCHGPASR